MLLFARVNGSYLSISSEYGNSFEKLILSFWNCLMRICLTDPINGLINYDFIWILTQFSVVSEQESFP